jgi:hypothetical protein
MHIVLCTKCCGVGNTNSILRGDKVYQICGNGKSSLHLCDTKKIIFNKYDVFLLRWTRINKIVAIE